MQTGISTNRIGAANMQALTLMAGVDEEQHISPEGEMGEEPVQKGNPAMFLVGFIILLAILWLARENSPFLQREVFGLNLFSVVVIGITAVVFIATAKFITARWPVPGLTPLIQSL